MAGPDDHDVILVGEWIHGGFRCGITGVLSMDDTARTEVRRRQGRGSRRCGRERAGVEWRRERKRPCGEELMNDSPKDSARPGRDLGSNSYDVIDIFDDGPGDATV